MMVGDRVIDRGLTVFQAEATAIYVCAFEPTTFGDATAGLIGSKTFSAGSAGTLLSAPASSASGGRKVNVTAITDGTIINSGTATAWAVVDVLNARLLAAGVLANALTGKVGQYFRLSPYEIDMFVTDVTIVSNLVASDFTDAVPLLAAATFKSGKQLSATPLTDSVPILSAGTFSLKNLVFVAASIVDSPPVLPAAVASKKVALPSSPLLDAVPIMGTPQVVPVTAAAPVVSTANFSLPASPGTDILIGTLTATNSPTSWAIVGGDPSGFFAVFANGTLRTSATINTPSGNYNLSITASNASGTSAPATIGVSVGAAIIPADRNFAWRAGVTYNGGIPVRNTIFTTLSPSGGDDTSQIQTALNNCPVGQVVKLSAGTFKLVAFQQPLNISTGITLRGSGAGVTFLQKQDNPAQGVVACPLRTSTLVPGTSVKVPPSIGTLDDSPLIQCGSARYGRSDNADTSTFNGTAGSSNLTANGVAGSFSVTVANASIFTVGAVVLVDELAQATYKPTPLGFLNNNTNGTANTVQVLSGDKVTWNIHTPNQTFQDGPPDSFGWFCRPDPVNVATGSYTDGRATSELKQIQSIVGNVITFDSPLTINYRTAHVAQVTRYSNTFINQTGPSIHVRNIGVESMTLLQSGGGGITFNCAAYSWVKNVEVNNCFSIGIKIANSFRCEVRDSYIHTSGQPTPAADSYAICPQNASSELLIENNIMIDYCKVIAFRSCGAGTVVAYNYTDDGWDYNGNPDLSVVAAGATWQECGMNASHMGGPHHVLFEGNYSWNCDSDYTWGNSIYMTHFRNRYTGQRRSFGPDGFAKCAATAAFGWWHSFIGNVLGRSGQMAGWTYTDSRMGCDINGVNCSGVPLSGWSQSTGWTGNAVWILGFDPERWSMNPEQFTMDSAIRDGNYDFLTNAQHWHTTPATFAMPNSMYLSSKPAFFGANTWPWTNPANGTVNLLPAKLRFDNGTPNTVP